MLDFAIIFGMTETNQSRSAITDIDPLALSPPADIKTETVEVTEYPVSRPENLTASLQAAISNGSAQDRVGGLLARIHSHNRGQAAKAILAELTASASLSDDDLLQLAGAIMSRETQRVILLVRYFAEGFAQHVGEGPKQWLAQLILGAVALDTKSPTGLSEQAEETLAISCAALAGELARRARAVTLDQHSIEMLIGDNDGSPLSVEPLLISFSARLN